MTLAQCGLPFQSQFAGELVGHEVAQLGVRSFGVVVFLAVGDTGPDSGQRREQRLVKAFVPETVVEALDEAVLHRRTGSDVMPLDLPLWDQRRIAMLVNSVPLSRTNVSGRLRPAMTVSSSRTTRRPDSEVSATSARYSRVWSSHHRQHRNLRLSAKLSLTKSGLQCWFGRPGTSIGRLVPRALLRPPRLRHRDASAS